VEPRKEPNFSYRLLRDLPGVSDAVPQSVIPGDELARAMVDVAAASFCTTVRRPV
jgi:hypothetical protein